MNIEEGKFYRTRDGRKAKVVHRFESREHDKGYFLVVSDAGGYWTVCADGAYSGCLGHPSSVVAEWREPVTVKGWVNVYADPTKTGFHLTKESADRYGDSDRIACVYIEGTEVPE